jgi:hypothetical protein
MAIKEHTESSTPAAESDGYCMDHISIVNEQLAQARAVLDLIHCGLGDTRTDRIFLESLFNATLATAMHGVIANIDAAEEAADRLNSEYRKATNAEEGSHE